MPFLSKNLDNNQPRTSFQRNKILQQKYHRKRQTVHLKKVIMSMKRRTEKKKIELPSQIKKLQRAWDACMESGLLRVSSYVNVSLVLGRSNPSPPGRKAPSI